jgi:translation elongation factor EF-Tu-like GTPase
MSLDLGFVFKSEETFYITGRGPVVTGKFLKGCERPTVPFGIHWEDPKTKEPMEGVCIGVEQFCNQLNKPFERGISAGLMIREFDRTTYNPGMIFHTLND